MKLFKSKKAVETKQVPDSLVDAIVESINKNGGEFTNVLAETLNGSPYLVEFYRINKKKKSIIIWYERDYSGMRGGFRIYDGLPEKSGENYNHSINVRYQNYDKGDFVLTKEQYDRINIAFKALLKKTFIDTVVAFSIEKEKRDIEIVNSISG